MRYYHLTLGAGLLIWGLGLLGLILELGPNATHLIAVGAGLIALAAYERASER